MHRAAPIRVVYLCMLRIHRSGSHAQRNCPKSISRNFSSSGRVFSCFSFLFSVFNCTIHHFL